MRHLFGCFRIVQFLQEETDLTFFEFAVCKSCNERHPHCGDDRRLVFLVRDETDGLLRACFGDRSLE